MDVDRSIFTGNKVSGCKQNGGGAVGSWGESVELRLRDCEFLANEVLGFVGFGGGAIGIRQASSVVLRNVRFGHNAIRVTEGNGYGGALHVETGDLELHACELHNNVAALSDPSKALSAVGGALSLASSAKRIMVLDTSFRSNQAGGIGAYQATEKSMQVEVDRAREISAAHVYTAAQHMLMERCRFSDDDA
jgi:hypothetical protein